MRTKTGKVEIPFKQLIKIIDQLSPEEKIILKKRLDKEKIPTWHERFSKSLRTLGKKNVEIPETEVKADVEKAIAEVRCIEKGQGSY